MFKLSASLPQAGDLASAGPDRFQAGSGPWVTVRFSAQAPLRKMLGDKWVKESHSLTVADGRKSMASATPAKKAGEKAAGKVAAKKSAKKVQSEAPASKEKVSKARAGAQDHALKAGPARCPRRRAARAIEQHAVEPPLHLICVSLGSMVALELAATRPDLARSACALSTFHDTRLRSLRSLRFCLSRWIPMRLAGPNRLARALGPRALSQARSSRAARTLHHRLEHQRPAVLSALLRRQLRLDAQRPRGATRLARAGPAR